MIDKCQSTCGTNDLIPRHERKCNIDLPHIHGCDSEVIPLCKWCTERSDCKQYMKWRLENERQD